MEAPYPGSAALNMASPPEELGNNIPTTNDAIGKLEGEATPIDPAETWSASAPDITKRSVSPLLSVQAAPVGNTTAETQNSVALKVATTVLQPICLGESPVVLPILAGPTTPHVGQTGAASYLMTSQGPVSIPFVLEQQVLQHLNPQLLQQAALPLQNTLLCQNPSLALGSPPALDQKGLNPVLDAGLLALLQNPSFAAVIQDIFPGPGSSSPTCHASPSPLIDLSSPFLPPFPPPNSSPLNHLVPPPTLLVPYPVVIPLPVPLPIPVPIPVPACKAESDSLKPICSRSTQTSTSDVPPHGKEQTRLSACSSPLVADGEVLDLSIRSPAPAHSLPPAPQDNVLDLSVPSVRKPCNSSRGAYGPSVDRQRACRLGDDVGGGELTLGVPRPVDRTPKLDAKLLSGLASLEFSRRHKWVVDSGHSSAMTGSVRDSALAGSGNIEIVSTSQTAKVIVSVKDAMPAIFRSKLKGLSGVSTKNFSIKRDGAQGGFPALPRVPADQRGELDDSPKKVSKSRGIKVKKVSSQEIHILPIKKQRLAAFLPRK